MSIHWSGLWLETCRSMPGRARKDLAGRASRDARIHAFRRTLKLWRSLLRLAPARLRDDADKMRRQLRVLRRQFGSARDRAMLANTLARYGGRAPRAGKASPASNALDSRHIDRIDLALTSLAATMASWRAQPGDVDEVIEAVRCSYRKARRRLGEGVGDKPIKDIHAFRTAIVDLSGQLGFIARVDPEHYGRMARRAEKLRDTLGKVVDCTSAQARLGQGKADRRTHDRLGSAITKSLARADRRAGKLLAERPRRFGKRLRLDLASS
jgi:CHAD domain-containing protein